MGISCVGNQFLFIPVALLAIPLYYASANAVTQEYFSWNIRAITNAPRI